jgi:nitric oxide reductase large subunit
MRYTKLWIGLSTVIIASFMVLGYFGREIYRQAPGSGITYTNNWPAEALIGNAPTGSIVIWSVINFVLLLAGIGALAWYFAAQNRAEPDAREDIPEGDPLLGLTPILNF